ncbi:hypothetical protein L596_021913 [Steinernema carpocapsae]|uniref:F-box domain-containing protein n=1 Tax=Steinernema carpocapsae TaxID=34508 RepID=A0A4U5MK68_STECR|nr:hypothetical protein L596_021913 [Steinernema carpocapsae]
MEFVPFDFLREVVSQLARNDSVYVLSKFSSNSSWSAKATARIYRFKELQVISAPNGLFYKIEVNISNCRPIYVDVQVWNIELDELERVDFERCSDNLTENKGRQRLDQNALEYVVKILQQLKHEISDLNIEAPHPEHETSVNRLVGAISSAENVDINAQTPLPQSMVFPRPSITFSCCEKLPKALETTVLEALQRSRFKKLCLGNYRIPEYFCGQLLGVIAERVKEKTDSFELKIPSYVGHAAKALNLTWKKGAYNFYFHVKN